MSRCPHCGSVHDALNHFCPVTGQALELGPRLIGQTLLAKYRVVTILGQGPIGIVLEVEDSHTSTRYAAKLIHPQFTRGHDAADKMLAEAQASASLTCENLAKVVEAGRDVGGAPLVVRELMVGECLQTRLDGQTRFSFEEATSIGIGVARALDTMHRKRLLNLDLSPADVFLARVEGRVIPKIVDLGEHFIKSKLSVEQLEDVESHRYWAPEQLAKSSPPGPRADVYAAGAVLFHLLTGRPPRAPLPRLSEVAPHVPPALARVIEKATAARPEDRHASAAELAADLLAASAPDAAAGPPKPRPSQPPKRPPTPPPMPLPSQPPAKPQSKVESASVIVDMPEMEKVGPGHLRKVSMIIGAVVLLAAVGVGAYLGLGTAPPPPPLPAASKHIEIKIEVTPAQADVFVDGMIVNAKPPIIETEPDGKLHTIGAKADGYEPRERDVRFDVSRTVTLALSEIVRPDDERHSTASDSDPGDKGTAQDPAAAVAPAAPVQGPKAEEKPKPKPTAAAAGKPKREARPDRATQPAKKTQGQTGKAGQGTKKTKDGFSLDNPFN